MKSEIKRLQIIMLKMSDAMIMKEGLEKAVRFSQHEAELTDLRQDCGMENKATSYGHGSRWFSLQSVNSQTWITLSMWNLRAPKL